MNEPVHDLRLIGVVWATDLSGSWWFVQPGAGGSSKYGTPVTSAKHLDKCAITNPFS